MSVKLTLQNATATTASVTIQLMKGTFELLSNHPLRVNGSFPFTSLSISNHAVNMAVANGASLSGSIDIPVTAGSGGTPSIQINNVSGDTVYVEWPTSDGQVTQELTPGTPMILSDLVSDGASS